jgi:hypothetical protein
MPNKIDIYFDSGGANHLHYEDKDPISYIEITNSDQEYYQNGKIQLYDIADSISVGQTVMVKIDDVHQISGYVTRKQQTIDKGQKVLNIQVIGKTYDLWRFITDDDAIYTGTSGYVASSLIASYCDGISASEVPYYDGVNISEPLDLRNMIVGDALVELTKSDGFNFYVDNDDKLIYFRPDDLIDSITIEESDIISMSPIEEADDDLINDVLVLGDTTYNTVTNLSPNGEDRFVIPSGVLVAQQFVLEDTTLSAVDLYLNRTRGANMPNRLNIEIWGNTDKKIIYDNFDDYSNFVYSSNMIVSGSMLVLDKDNGSYETIGHMSSSTHTFDTKYMKIDLVNAEETDNIFISGTNDGGITWETLTDGDWIEFDSKSSDGSSIKIKYTSDGAFTPKISRYHLYVSDESNNHGTGGLPKSGTLVEWSDDIGVSVSDMPYPPSYTGWKEYSPPKLLFENELVGNKCWIILKHDTEPETKYWEYYYDDTFTYEGKIAHSWDKGVLWSTNATEEEVPNGNMKLKMGWKLGRITYRTFDDDSINTYGRHLKRITDSSITNLAAAQLRGDFEVSSSKDISKKGTLVINGNSTVNLGYKVHSELHNFDIDEYWIIRSYIQRIDKNGFTTTINYGKQPFDLVHKLAMLENIIEQGET